MDAEVILFLFFFPKNIRMLDLDMTMSLLCDDFSYPWSGGMKLWMKGALSREGCTPENSDG